jgi:hypothetical protein
MSHQKSHTGNINITSDSEKAWQKSKNNPHSHTNPHQGDHMPAINNKNSHANLVMPSLSTTLVHYLVLQISTSPVLRTYKKSQEMPLQEQQIPPASPSQLRPWELKKASIAETRSSHLSSPFGVSVPYILFICNTPHFLSFCVSF